MSGLFHPGLIWKELRYGRWYFALLFTGLLAELLVYPVMFLGYGTDEMLAGLSPWGYNVRFILDPGSSLLESSAMLGAVLLAALLLAGERGNGLRFLAVSPVSRRQILAAKWLTGSLAILTAMAGTAVGMAALIRMEPAAASFSQFLIWWGMSTAALLCLFSLALMTAAWFNGVIYAALFTAGLLIFPAVLTAIIVEIPQVFGIFSPDTIQHIYALQNYLYIPMYITGEGLYGHFRGEGGMEAALLVVLLLLGSLLFWRLAICSFERNPLERQGEVLLCGNFKQAGRILLAFLLAPGLALERSTSPGTFVLYALLFWVAIYAGLGLLWRLTERLGLEWREEAGR